MNETHIITVPAGTICPEQPEFQVLVRDGGSSADIRRTFGVWTPVEVYGGTIESCSAPKLFG